MVTRWSVTDIISERRFNNCATLHNVISLLIFYYYYLTTHSTHFSYGYMVKGPFMGYSFRLAAWIILYASSHRQDNTNHSLCYTSRGALAGTRNSLMGSLWRFDPMTHRTMSERSYHRATSHYWCIDNTSVHYVIVTRSEW